MSDPIEAHFRQAVPAVDFCSLRLVSERSELLAVRQDVLQPVVTSEDRGAMLTVWDGGGMGYAATGDLSPSGLRQAIDEARQWARDSAARSVVDFSKIVMEPPRGEYASPEVEPWRTVSLADKIDLLQRESARLKIDPRIVDWDASLWHTDADTLYLTADGGRVQQSFRTLVPSLSATANDGPETQTRTFGGRGYCRQGGLEVLDHLGFRQAAPQVAEEAIQLLLAPNCPSGTLDVLLAPDQMILQIHESIGHPLELDRILGDERNYAGTSFVTADMFGTYRYGSDLLNYHLRPHARRKRASLSYDLRRRRRPRRRNTPYAHPPRSAPSWHARLVINGGTSAKARRSRPGVADVPRAWRPRVPALELEPPWRTRSPSSTAWRGVSRLNLEPGDPCQRVGRRRRQDGHEELFDERRRQRVQRGNFHALITRGPPQAQTALTSPSTPHSRKPSPATPSTTTASRRNTPTHPPRYPAARPRRPHLAGARRRAGRGDLTCLQLEPPADRPHGEPQPGAGRCRP